RRRAQSFVGALECRQQHRDGLDHNDPGHGLYCGDLLCSGQVDWLSRNVGLHSGGSGRMGDFTLTGPGLLRIAATLSLVMLEACVSDRDPPAVGDPSFYRSMASAGAALDAPTAASMISGYRSNNGLDAVTVDPACTRHQHACSN